MFKYLNRKFHINNWQINATAEFVSFFFCFAEKLKAKKQFVENNNNFLLKYNFKTSLNSKYLPNLLLDCFESFGKS